MSKPKRKKKKERPVFRPLSPVTRSKCKRLEEEGNKRFYTYVLNSSGPEVLKNIFILNSAENEIVLLINVKMPTTFMGRKISAF